MLFVGAWLSLVEHVVRDYGVAGSNPVAPIKPRILKIRRNTGNKNPWQGQPLVSISLEIGGFFFCNPKTLNIDVF